MPKGYRPPVALTRKLPEEPRNSTAICVTHSKILLQIQKCQCKQVVNSAKTFPKNMAFKNMALHFVLWKNPSPIPFQVIPICQWQAGISSSLPGQPCEEVVSTDFVLKVMVTFTHCTLNHIKNLQEQQQQHHRHHRQTHTPAPHRGPCGAFWPSGDPLCHPPGKVRCH